MNCSDGEQGVGAASADRASEGARSGTASAELAATKPPAATDPHLKETAIEYRVRRGETAPFEPGEIDAGAVGGVVACVICHGSHGEGIAALDTPRIGGIPEWYLARQLK